MSRTRNKGEGTISDVAGNILIDVQPDFSGFERELTEGLKQAAENAQKAAATSFNQGARNIQQVKKETDSLTVSSGKLETVLESINRTMQTNARAVQSLNRSIKESTKVAQQGSTAFQRLVEVVANLSIVFNAFVQVTEFIRLAGGAVGAADDLRGRFEALASLVAELSRRFTKNVTEITRTKQAFTTTEKAVRKTGGAVTGTTRTVIGFGKAAKTTADTVQRTEQTVQNLTSSTGFFGSAVDKSRGFLRRFNDESGKVSLDLLNGERIVASVSRAFNRFGTVVSDNAKRAVGGIKGTRDSLLGFSATLNGLSNKDKILNTLSTSFRNLGGASKNAAKDIGSFAANTAAGKFAKSILFGSKAVRELEDSFARAAGRAVKTNGILGLFNLTLLRTSRRIDDSSDALGRFDIFGRITSEAIARGFGKIFTSVDNVTKALLRMGNAAGGLVGTASFFSRIGTFATGVGVLAGVATAAGGTFVALAQRASTLNESINATSVTLGDASAKFSELIGNSQDLGISQTALNQAITPLVPILRSAGLEGDRLAEELNTLVRRGVDLSSIFNESVEQSLTSVTAAIRGEIEPARRLGITFNAAEVEAKALALGFQKVDGDLSESAKQFTRLQLVLEKSAFAEGDFANTSEELANSQRILGAIISDTVSKISAAFLPAAKAIINALTDAAKRGNGFVEFFRAAEPTITALGKSIARLIEVFSLYGGTISKLLLPVLQTLAPLLATLTELVGSFVAKILTIGLFTNTIKILAVVLAALPATIVGVSGALSSLTGASQKLLGPLLVLTGVLGFFAKDLDGSAGALGFLGDAFSAVSGIIQVFLARALALRALPGILTAVNSALKQLSFDKLSIDTGKLSARLTPLVGILGAAAGAILFLDSRTKSIQDSVVDLSDDFKELRASLSEFNSTAEGIRLAEIFEEEVEKTLSFSSRLKAGASSIFKDVIRDPLGLSGVSEGIEKLESQRAIEFIQQLFSTSPEQTAALVKQLTLANSKFAKEAQTELKRLQDEARKTALESQAVADTFAEFETLLARAASASRLFEQLQDIQERINGANVQLNDLIRQREKLIADVVAKQLEEFNAAKSVRDIQRQIEDTIKERANLTQQILDIDKERKQIESDFLSIAQERRDIEAQIQELLKPPSPEDIQEALDRITVAQINVNKAKREELKLQEEILNKVKEGEDIQLNLAGLSLDEVRSRLASARAAAAAQRSRRKETDTTEELLTDEEKIQLAAINTRDAQRDLNDAQTEFNNLQKPEITNRERIQTLQNELVRLTDREEDLHTQIAGLLTDEEGIKIRIQRIDEDAPGLILSKQQAEQDYQAILSGEEGIQNQIHSLNEQIKQQRLEIKNLAADEKLAVDKIREGEEAVEAVMIRRNLKRLEELGLIDSISGKLDDLAKKEVGKIVEASLLSTLSPEFLQGEKGSQTFDRLFNQIVNNPQVISRITDALLVTPGADIKEILKQILRELNLNVPGFSAEGSVVTGSPGPLGQLMHVGEYSRPEAILPLTKPGRFASVLQQSLPYAHPAVRNMIGQMYEGSILDGVPRVNLTGGKSQALRSRKPSYTSGSTAFQSAKPSRLEQKLDRLIQLQEEANEKDVGINAPITIQGATNPDLTAKKTVRELEKQLRRGR